MEISILSRHTYIYSMYACGKVIRGSIAWGFATERLRMDGWMHIVPHFDYASW